MEHVTVPRGTFEVASPFGKECGPKKVALKEGNERIIFGFGCHVLTSIPLKLQKLTLSERTFSTSFRFRKIANAMAKVCAERKNRTRRLWLLVCCRNL